MLLRNNLLLQLRNPKESITLMPYRAERQLRYQILLSLFNITPCKTGLLLLLTMTTYQSGREGWLVEKKLQVTDAIYSGHHVWRACLKRLKRHKMRTTPPGRCHQHHHF
jgi:uncharacterized membrane protein